MQGRRPMQTRRLLKVAGVPDDDVSLQLSSALSATYLCR